LSGRDFRFAWVTVLSNQIAGKAGKMIIFNITLTSLAYFNQFAGAGKMIIRIIP